jgi:hypothetical protein
MHVVAALTQAAAEYAGTLAAQGRRTGWWNETSAFLADYFWVIIAGGVIAVLLLMVVGPKTRV